MTSHIGRAPFFILAVVEGNPFAYTEDEARLVDQTSRARVPTSADTDAELDLFSGFF